MKSRILTVIALATGLAVVLASAVGALAAGSTMRISVASHGTQGNARSRWPAISADGRHVVFESDASNIVAGDTNNQSDIFAHDQATHETTRVSLAHDGTQANGPSVLPSVSADGRYVAFTSWANDLVPGDTNDASDVFVRDLAAGQTTRVSIATDGTQGTGDSYSGPLSISADGRFVAFYSYASDLVAQDTNGVSDVFVRDRHASQTLRVSVAPDGTQANGSGSWYPAMSADGCCVAFQSTANNFDPPAYRNNIYVRHMQAATTTWVSIGLGGEDGNDGSYECAISDDGRYVAFTSFASNLVPNDNNGQGDVFLRDLQTATTELVSLAYDGTPGNGSSAAWKVGISLDGRQVIFDSYASNLVPDDTNGQEDVFVRDRQTGQTTRVSVATDGTEGNGAAGYWGKTISSDGRYVAFMAAATNLVTGDTNGVADVFLHDRIGGPAPWPASAVVAPTGGALSAWDDAATFIFPAGSFTETVVITYSPAYDAPPSATLRAIGYSFDVTATYTNTTDPASLAPGHGYTVTVQYSDAERGPTVEDTLALYHWNGGAWVKETSSIANATANTVTATPNHLSLWAVLGETHRLFLPFALRHY